MARRKKQADAPPLPPEEAHDAEVIAQSPISKCKDLEITITGSTVVPNIDHASKILHARYNGHVWFDEFYQKYFTNLNFNSNENTLSREWDDDDTLRITLLIQREYGIARMSDETVKKALRVYAKDNIKNAPKDWMASLVWDEKPRIETFFIDCAGSDDNEYARAVSKNFWLSIAARVMSPGCKVDTMPILEGKQGTLKSTLLQIIGGDLHCEASHDLTNKDFFQALHGKMIIEFADLSSFSKSEINLIKDILVRKSDYIRLPYAALFKDFPRQSVFTGTTNNMTYLKDTTGARRFWPISTGQINIERAKNEREQLFAEAVALFKQGIKWWEMPDRTAEEQELRREIDPWETIIANFICTRQEVTTQEIMIDCLHIDPQKQDRFMEMRIGNILRMFEWVRRQKRIGNTRPYVYEPPKARMAGVTQDEVNWEE